MNQLDEKVMIDSYNNISFYGEKRGAEDFRYYSEMLKSDLEELGDNQGNYREKFIDKVMAIYHRQSNCTSSFIVGPANYNLRRHEKVWASRDKAESDFNHWREKYFKAVNRVRAPSPEDEIESAIEEIDALIAKRDALKEWNKTKDESLIPLCTSSLFSVEHFNQGLSVPSWRISSLTTKIRERKQKIEVMKARIERKESFEPIKFKGGHATIENDRVVIYHDEKPSREVIQQIKGNGFRWSPKMKCWCRKHTGNAIYALNDLLGAWQ